MKNTIKALLLAALVAIPAALYANNGGECCSKCTADQCCPACQDGKCCPACK